VNRTTSVYLDAVRLLAALAVVLTHLAYPRFSGGRLIALRTYGNDAVMIFFVLSGYVIAYTAATRDRDLRTYAVNRLARLYSVALPAVFLTFAFDEIGRRVDPSLYDGFWYKADDPLGRMLAALTFTNELWFRSVRLFTNGPYWSLGYEFWYYALFAAAWFFQGRTRWVLTAAIAAIMGPKILLLLPVWLLGVWVYRTNGRGGVAAGWGGALFLGSIALYVAFRATGLRDALLEWTYAELGRGFVRGELRWSDEFLSAWVIGVLVACNFLGCYALSSRFAPLLARVERAVREGAGYTFSIYLFHYPVMQLLAALSPLDPRSPVAIALLFGGTVLTCCGLGWFTEKRKDRAREWVGRLLPPALATSPRRPSS
jgi:peptidoglycan/LPS O-acetylase OafA/YrhL